MTVLTTIFLTSFVIALSGAMMPGPLLSATIAGTSRHGFVAGPLLILGHGILEMLLLLALLLGLAPYLSQDWVFVVIALAGAGMLVWMGIGMLKGLAGQSLDLDTGEDGTTSRGRLVWGGIFLSLANPYWIIWWATVGLGYILQFKDTGLAGMGAFFIGHILADLAWYAIVAGAVSQGRRFLTDSRYRGLIGACAVFLIVFAGYFAWAGLRRGVAIWMG